MRARNSLCPDQRQRRAQSRLVQLHFSRCNHTRIERLGYRRHTHFRGYPPVMLQRSLEGRPAAEISGQTYTLRIESGRYGHGAAFGSTNSRTNLEKLEYGLPASAMN